MFVQQSRNIQIDTLRGLACILLVSYHVIGNTPFSGLRISDGFLRELNDLLIYVRMPLFTVLSGFVYAYRPFRGDALKFVGGKLRRLIVPMLIVGTLFAVLQSAIPGTNGGVENWYLLHIIPHAHFWFVEALFLIFMMVLVLELCNGFSSPLRALFILLAVAAIYLSPLRMQWFGMNGAMYLFPYFLLGMYLNRFDLLKRIDSRYAIAVVILICLILVFFKDEIPSNKRGWQALLIGGIACVALLGSGVKSKFLARIGVYSYSIYLFHVFFTAASRILFQKAGLDWLGFLLVAGLIAGILGPMVVEVVLSRFSYTRFLFLGQKLRSAKA